MHTTSRFLRTILPIAVGLGSFLTSTAFAANAAVRPALSISVPAEITSGASAMIIVNAKIDNVNRAGVPITALRLDFPIDPIDPDATPASIQLIPGNVTLHTNADGNVSVLLNTADYDLPVGCGYSLRAQSGSVAGLYQTEHTVSISFCIKSYECGSPFVFELTDVSGPGELLASTKNSPKSGVWFLTYTVKACTDIVAGTKVQGGLVAWANYSNVVASVGDVTISAKNKNKVVTWIVPAMAAGDVHTITIEIRGNSPSTLGTQHLSGAWSAVYQTLEEANNVDPITGLPAPIPAAKSEYTPRASFEVVGQLTP